MKKCTTWVDSRAWPETHRTPPISHPVWTKIARKLTQLSLQLVKVTEILIKMAKNNQNGVMVHKLRAAKTLRAKISQLMWQIRASRCSRLATWKLDHNSKQPRTCSIRREATLSRRPTSSAAMRMRGSLWRSAATIIKTCRREPQIRSLMLNQFNQTVLMMMQRRLLPNLRSIDQLIIRGREQQQQQQVIIILPIVRREGRSSRAMQASLKKSLLLRFMKLEVIKEAQRNRQVTLILG